MTGRQMWREKVMIVNMKWQSYFCRCGVAKGVLTLWLKS